MTQLNNTFNSIKDRCGEDFFNCLFRIIKDKDWLQPLKKNLKEEFNYTSNISNIHFEIIANILDVVENEFHTWDIILEKIPLKMVKQYFSNLEKEKYNTILKEYEYLVKQHGGILLKSQYELFINYDDRL